MLNLALVALLSGSLLTGSPDGDCEKGKTDCETAQAAQAEMALPAPSDERSIISDTWAMGRASDAAPIKLWVEGGYGEAQTAYGPDGEEVTDLTIAGTQGDIIAQRVSVGAQINVINFPAFKLGVGGQLDVGKTKFQCGSGGCGLLAGDLESSFGLQNVKIYGTLRGRVVGIHGGYMIDLGDAQTFNGPLPADLGSSDQRDAIFFGGDFDYPSRNFRLFGGADYILLQDDDAVGDVDDSYILMFNMGAGVRFGIIELGAAFLLRTQTENPGAERLGIIPGATATGNHSGTIAPYLKLSPPSLPVSLYVQGAVLDEYSDYGYTIGGANDVKPGLGVTVGLSIGFE